MARNAALDVCSCEGHQHHGEELARLLEKWSSLRACFEAPRDGELMDAG